MLSNNQSDVLIMQAKKYAKLLRNYVAFRTIIDVLVITNSNSNEEVV